MLIIAAAAGLSLFSAAAQDSLKPAAASTLVSLNSAVRAAPEGEMALDSYMRSRPELSADGAGGTLEGRAPALEFGIDMPWSEESFQSYRDTYLSAGGRRWLSAIMSAAEPYFAYVAERVRYYGLPDELAYLPVIESEYSPKAVSRSGAAGLWQFMRNSVKGYSIHIDDWVDERRDFTKSTDAAMQKLSENYEYFGDWPLALAAYNAGLGAVSRIEKTALKCHAADEAAGRTVEPLNAKGFVSYWELRSRGLLRKETAGYVPKFLAVASILRYSARNGLPVSWDDAEDWESIDATRTVDLVLLAKAAKIPYASLKAGNAELRYTITPPYAGYKIKVPAENAEAVRAALDDPSLKLLRYYMHKINSGDTLLAISKHYGTPVNMILDANPGLKPNLLRIGAVVVVPALKDVGPMSAPPRPEADPSLDFSGAYTIVKGDTLWSISLRYGVQPEVLADKNGLSLSSVLHEGSTLKVPILK